MGSERIGSSFESFLHEEGIGEGDAAAQERVFAWQMEQATTARRRELIEQNTRYVRNLDV